MKWISSILIFLIIFDLVLPCSSMDRCHSSENACHSEQVAQEESCHAHCANHADSASEEDSEEEHQDAPCSSDCNCYCCAVVLLPRPMVPMLYTQQPEQELIRFKSSDRHTDFSYQVWQPPRALT